MTTPWLTEIDMSGNTMRTWCIGLTVLIMALTSAVAEAGGMKVNAVLIWGTNDSKSPNPAHKPVEKELAQKFAKVFKWKNYFEVKRVCETIPDKGTRRLRMSPKCEIEVKDVENSKIEVKLFGEGKFVNKVSQKLQKGQMLTLAGEDKGENSWFIIITQAD
jgi:hypothetical protein